MFEARIEHTDPVTVAYLEMHGAFSQIPQALGRLYGWVQERSLVPGGMPRAVYYTIPEQVPEEAAFWEVQAPLIGDAEDQVPDESGLGIKHIGPETHAVAVHTGPYETIGPVYSELGAWVEDQGFRMAGAPLEVYLSDPAKVPPSEYVTEIRFPVHGA